MKKVRFYLVMLLAIASLSGCEKEPTCNKCENCTDTVYVGYDKTDSVMNLLCRNWKLEAFVDTQNGNMRTPSGSDDSDNYLLTFNNDFTYSMHSCDFDLGGQFLIPSSYDQSSILFSMLWENGDVSQCLENPWDDLFAADGYLFIYYVITASSYEVNEDSLQLFSNYANEYLLFKQI